MPVVHRSGGEFPAARVAPVARRLDVRPRARDPFPSRVPRQWLLPHVAALGPVLLLLRNAAGEGEKGKRLENKRAERLRTWDASEGRHLPPV